VVVLKILGCVLGVDFAGLCHIFFVYLPLSTYLHHLAISSYRPGGAYRHHDGNDRCDFLIANYP
jgi:hypothetical protein